MSIYLCSSFHTVIKKLDINSARKMSPSMKTMDTHCWSNGLGVFCGERYFISAAFVNIVLVTENGTLNNGQTYCKCVLTICLEVLLIGATDGF